jgi:hypothetical protein
MYIYHKTLLCNAQYFHIVNRDTWFNNAQDKLLCFYCNKGYANQRAILNYACTRLRPSLLSSLDHPVCTDRQIVISAYISP